MIQETAIPDNSSLSTTFPKVNYKDCFKVNVDPKVPIQVEDVARIFFLSAPQWVVKLMQVRDKIAKKLKLKTNNEKERSVEDLKKSRFEVGERFGLFQVTNRDPNEIIMGTDDSHLNFRVSIYLEPGNQSKYEIYIATIVQINNWVGRLYFLTIERFHKIVVKTFMKRIRKEINSL